MSVWPGGSSKADVSLSLDLLKESKLNKTRKYTTY
jgi:hypothetical protein